MSQRPKLFTKAITVRFNPRDFERLRDLAAERDMPVAVFIREIVLMQMYRE